MGDFLRVVERGHRLTESPSASLLFVLEMGIIVLGIITKIFIQITTQAVLIRSIQSWIK